ncbi:hypothetical protein GQ53DRAFT_821151 [Thozetella sp. PMI_491]|nr:hypothetical protein GQ53DRAFT_821151 [Thozetella sp. PMI_491]
MDLAVDFSTWLTGTTELSVHGGFERGSETWPIIRTAIQHMRNLNEVSLSRESFGLFLAAVYDNLDTLRHLKTLSLNGMSPGGSALDSLRQKRGLSPITVLIITDFMESPSCLRRLVEWPAKLEEFVFEHLYYNEFSGWNMQLMVSILSPHKSTLKAIRLGGLSQSGLAGLDFTDFGSLEELSLSYWATGCQPNHVANILAPHLRRFRWSFTIEDQHNESWEDFGKPQEDWLRRLAAAATTGNVPLDEIQIQYWPDRLYTWDAKRYQGMQYPWDRMDALAKEFQPSGITLQYNTPPMTKEEFLQTLKNANETPEWDEDSNAAGSQEENGILDEGAAESDGSGRNSEPGSTQIGLSRQSNKILNYFSPV